MDKYEDEVEFIDYLNVIWKRKWLIIIPTLFITLAAGAFSFLIPPKWEVDAILLPSKFFVQTEQGQFEEVVVIDPRQIAGQINQKSFNSLITAELNLNPRKFPSLSAENLRDTKLVRVVIRDTDVARAKSILQKLFDHLKTELDKKINVEVKAIDSKIITKEKEIREKVGDFRTQVRRYHRRDEIRKEKDRGNREATARIPGREKRRDGGHQPSPIL
jgi:capsular polysaccharide biosynthesis protein